MRRPALRLAYAKVDLGFAKGFDADGRMRPARTVETDDPEEAIRLATAAVADTGRISAACIFADWRLCATLPDFFHVNNGIGRWLEQNPIEGSFVGEPTDDLDFWRELGVETPEQLAKFLLIESYSDRFKAMFGFRPVGNGFTMETPIEEIEAALDRLTSTADPDDGPRP
ncbi:hypothetical protein [Cereibacter sphaeroides]|uniref:hypothetical protein n=1 Tax=Cereibacter sphaeroides TaxID=1063 RepID=UPI001F172B8D|nr:hypothetical protein [Cereibacter sphaeroides]MCE6971310.1 hypothetical protein [Cereibacter sphaeroides]